MVQCPLRCCISLKTQCKIIAILQIVFGSLLLILSTIFLFSLLILTSTLSEDDLDDYLPGDEVSAGQVFSGILVVGSLTILFAFILWKGVRDNKEGKVRVWIYANFTGFILLAVIWVVLAVQHELALGGWLYLVLIAIHLYFIIVVYVFMRRVHREKKGQVKGRQDEKHPENSKL